MVCSQPTNSKRTILCIDTSREALAAYIQLLEQSGFAVLAVTGDRSATRILQRNSIDAVVIGESADYDAGALAIAARQLGATVIILVNHGDSRDMPVRPADVANVVLRQDTLRSQLVPRLKFLFMSAKSL